MRISSQLELVVFTGFLVNLLVLSSLDWSLV